MNGTRTFGRKSVRMSSAERESLEKVLPLLEIKTAHLIDKESVFNRSAPLYLEIGFGNGEFLYESALKNPEHDFVGVEIFISGVAKLLRRMVSYDNSNPPCPSNIRVIMKDALNTLIENIPECSLDGVYILFPDPWPRKRHQKRRLLTGDFADTLYTRLKDNGFVTAATDHEGYACRIMESFLSSGYTISETEYPSGIKKTRYATMAIEEGRQLFIYRFQKGLEPFCVITG